MKRLRIAWLYSHTFTIYHVLVDANSTCCSDEALEMENLISARLLSNQVTTCIALKDFVQSVQLTGESIQLVPCLLECSKFGNQWKGH
ncbi:hypothetical protein Pyn_37764 [Prunus yedoensis var. nudiflora]|uniref:Uncharacterized protein n=1 Tax=Prunus yedoensis var. nudiflora TaxID=2094558 RepID=A0A314ZAA3_PRUYE|nr:hypothetical protein Pyn_37764 [Prunus yedoensis var. nudiflora]